MRATNMSSQSEYVMTSLLHFFLISHLEHNHGIYRRVAKSPIIYGMNSLVRHD